MRVAPLGILVSALLACAKDAPVVEAEAGVFEVGAVPLLQIGVSDGDPVMMFHRARSAHRYPDGRIVVADGGSRQLRWFAPDGAPAGTAGRQGRGPQEFAGGIQLLAWPGDTVAAYDNALRRVSIFTPEGTFVRTEEAGPERPGLLPLDPWLFRRTAVFGAAEAITRACVAEVLRGMPLPAVEDGLRFLTVDQSGRFWVREGARGQARWTVLRRDGTLLGVAGLSPSFELIETSEGFVLGRQAAEDGTERIVLHAVTDTRAAGDCLPNATEPPEVPSPALLTTQMRNLMTAQEATYANAGSYTTTVPEHYVKVVEGTAFWLHEADVGGWVGAIFDLKTEVACAMAVGWTLTAWWPDGKIICG